MMRIGWLADTAHVLGGAELTQAEFRAAAPEDVVIVDCPPGAIIPGLDRYVVHNCVTYTAEELERLPADRPLIKYWHDIGPHLPAAVHDLFAQQATQICCSPIQAEHMGIKSRCIPPALNLHRFEQAGMQVNGSRRGAVSIASWRNHGKAPHRAAEWGAMHGGVEFYGDGVFAPPGSMPVTYEQMPDLLARYKTFVFLPVVLEPFGRLVAEAWAAGCEVVTNELVGARHWIEHDPDALETAAADFWQVVLA